MFMEDVAEGIFKKTSELESLVDGTKGGILQVTLSLLFNRHIVTVKDGSHE